MEIANVTIIVRTKTGQVHKAVLRPGAKPTGPIRECMGALEDALDASIPPDADEPPRDTDMVVPPSPRGSSSVEPHAATPASAPYTPTPVAPPQQPTITSTHATRAPAAPAPAPSSSTENAAPEKLQAPEESE